MTLVLLVRNQTLLPHSCWPVQWQRLVVWVHRLVDLLPINPLLLPDLRQELQLADQCPLTRMTRRLLMCECMCRRFMLDLHHALNKLDEQHTLDKLCICSYNRSSSVLWHLLHVRRAWVLRAGWVHTHVRDQSCISACTEHQFETSNTTHTWLPYRNDYQVPSQCMSYRAGDNPSSTVFLYMVKEGNFCVVSECTL